MLAQLDAVDDPQAGVVKNVQERFGRDSEHLTSHVFKEAFRFLRPHVFIQCWQRTSACRPLMQALGFFGGCRRRTLRRRLAPNTVLLRVRPPDLDSDVTLESLSLPFIRQLQHFVEEPLAVLKCNS